MSAGGVHDSFRYFPPGLMHSGTAINDRIPTSCATRRTPPTWSVLFSGLRACCRRREPANKLLRSINLVTHSHMAEEESTQGRQNQKRHKLPLRSDVWDHFTRLRDDHGNFLDQAKCNSCANKVFDTKHGNSNMQRHFNKFHKQGDAVVGARATRPPLLPTCDHPPRPAESSHPQPIPQNEADRESGSNHEEASRDLARMIVLHGYDPSVVEDDYFRSFVRSLNPAFEVPSRVAIEKMCVDIFRDSMRDLHRSNADDPAKVSVAVGRSKTIETGQVVYVTTHFIDGHWNLHRDVDNVRMALPAGDHYHVPLRQVPVVSLDDDAVDDIVSAIPYGMIINQNGLFMIAGEATGLIHHLKLKDCFQEKGLVENIIYSATYMDHVLHSIARCLLPDSEFAEMTFAAIDEVQFVLSLQQAEILSKLGLAKIGLLDDPWEYDERWYSCYCSLEIIRQKNIELDSDDCTDQLLCTLWREIYSAIIKISDCSRPTSNLCLQELFKVRDVLKSQLSEALADPPHAGNYSDFDNKNVADVLTEALETVDKAIQDLYLVWSIPLVLDPRYKLRSIKTYFEKAFGLLEAEKYVSEIRRKTKELYTNYIFEDDEEDGDEDSEGSAEEMSVDSSTHLEQALDERCRSQDDSHEEAENELDDYLKDSLVRGTEGFDILKWWKDQGSVQYPTVARMARDALAMPTCSKLTSNQIAQVKSKVRGYDQMAQVKIMAQGMLSPCPHAVS